MAPYAFNTTTSMTLGVRRLLKYTVVALATTASAPTLALAATATTTTAESTWSVVRSVVEELPAGVQFWSLGDKETTFERPAPVVLDEHVLGDLRSEFSFMQDFPASVDESTTFDSTSRSFVAAIPHGHVQGGSGLVFDDAGRVYHEKNQHWERNNAKPPMPVATSSQKHYKLLATTIQKYGHMYFHFMLETLQKIVMLKPHMDAHPEMKILTWGSSWEKAFLKKLGISESRVVKYEPYVENGSDIPGVVDYSADALLMPTPSMRITPSREGLMLTREALGVKAAPVDQRNLVIYATRKNESSRRVANEAEVLAALERAVEGTKYEVVVFEGMADNLDETMELFSKAAVVVGPHGAGLSHLLFAPEGTAVLEFQFVRDPPMMFWSAAAALKQTYYLLPVPGSFWLQEEMDVPAEDVYELVSLALGGSRETASSDCPAGTYSTSGKCLPCAAGRFSADDDVAACRTCPPNTFADEGMSECTACPEGTIAWLPGSKSVGDCMSPNQHLNMLTDIEEQLIKLNKLNPSFYKATRRALIELSEQGEGYFQTMVEGDGDAETTAPASMPTILDPRIASIAVEGGMEDYVPVVPGQMHLAVGDPGPGASALCRLQRIAEASGWMGPIWWSYTGFHRARFLSRSS
ncbi:Ephrin_rec_like domain-containing protein [Pycnococcus provasolii]